MDEINIPLWVKVVGVLLIVGGLIAFSVIKYLPEYLDKLGSSDTLFKYNDYKTTIEVSLSTKPNFFLIVDKKNKISNIFFLNEESTVLYNQDIENNSLSKSIGILINKLNENEYLNDCTITITNYGDTKIYKKVTDSFNKELSTLNNNSNILENSSNLFKKAQELRINSSTEKDILTNLYLISSNIINYHTASRNKVEIAEPKEVTLTEETAKKYADNIYSKLQSYIINHNIQKQKLEDAKIKIELIPGDPESSIYPDTDSWYYIEDYKVYAYIKFTNNDTHYHYCYKGSLENMQKGGC